MCDIESLSPTIDDSDSYSYSYSDSDNEDKKINDIYLRYTNSIKSSNSVRSTSKKRLIPDWFSNITNSIDYQKYKKKSIAYVFNNKMDITKCDLTVDGITHQNLDERYIKSKLSDYDSINFSLGNGQTFSLSSHFAEWIIDNFNPNMWREVGIHVYIMFGNEWSSNSHYKASNMINQCLALWKIIKKDVYISFCNIVLDLEYDDIDDIPESIIYQINRVMWSNSIKDIYQNKFDIFWKWYHSKLIEEFNKKKSYTKDQKNQFFHHMFNFCGFYTMHKYG